MEQVQGLDPQIVIAMVVLIGAVVVLKLLGVVTRVLVLGVFLVGAAAAYYLYEASSV